MEWIHYRETLNKQSAAAAYDDLETPPLKVNTFLITDHISVENKNTTYTNLRIGIKSGTTFTPLEEEKVPDAGEVYWTRNELQFKEHERVCCRLTGCTNNDLLEVTIQGRLYLL